MPQRVLGKNVRANHQPFSGRGASLYAGVGSGVGIDPGPNSVVFRKLRTLGGNICKGSGWSIANGINKTCRIAHVSDPTSVFSYAVPAGWHDRIVYLQVRTHWSNCETVINPDPVRLDFTNLGAVNPVIHGTGEILSAEKRDGGVYRILTRYYAVLDGTQPTSLVIHKSAGTGTIADVTATYDPDQQTYIFDTPALTDAAAYTFQFKATNGAVTLTLDSITFTADAAGPPAATSVTLSLT